MKIPSYGGVDTAYVGTTAYSGDMVKKSMAANGYQNQVNRIQKNETKIKKKKLNYKYKEISSAIRQCKKSNNASLVVTKAKSALSNLLKSQGTGRYNEAELENAIKHAKKMVQCAKMKASHLKQEENRKNQNMHENQIDRRKHGKSERSQVQERQEMTDVEIMLRQKIKSREHALNQISGDHRSKERKKLDEADLEYLKRKLELMAGDSSSGDVVSQISPDYGMGADMGFILAEVEAVAEVTAEVAAEGIDVCL